MIYIYIGKTIGDMEKMARFATYTYDVGTINNRLTGPEYAGSLDEMKAKIERVMAEGLPSEVVPGDYVAWTSRYDGIASNEHWLRYVGEEGKKFAWDIKHKNGTWSVGD